MTRISHDSIQEVSVSVMGAGSRLEGKIHLDGVTRVHGTLAGEVTANANSTLILCETSVVEGSIRGDTVVVDGYVEGDIFAQTKVVVSRTGRVIGNISTPSLCVEFGAHFDGRCFMVT